MPVIERIREEFAARPRRLAIALSLVVVILAVVWFSLKTWRGAAPPTPPAVYYANDLTGELSLQSLEAYPPLVNGDTTLVRAALYSTDGGKTKVAAYYEKYSDAVKRMLDEAARNPDRYDERLIARGRLVRLPEKGSPWVPAHSAEGQKILASMPTGDNVTYCSVVSR